MSKDLMVQEERSLEKAKTDHQFELIEAAVIGGDLARLSPQERVTYYNKVCQSLGLNPYTKPFDYITLNGKLTLYAKKDATEQLRKINGISITGLEEKFVDDLYIVTATAMTKDGRIDQAKGAVSLGALRGEQKANAIMKAETKAKRRVTLSISGMGWVDESEVDSIPNASRTVVNIHTGEIESNESPQLQIQNSEKYVSAEQAEEIVMLLDLCDPHFKDAIVKHYASLKINADFSNLSLKGFNVLRERLTQESLEYQQNFNTIQEITE